MRADSSGLLPATTCNGDGLLPVAVATQLGGGGLLPAAAGERKDGDGLLPVAVPTRAGARTDEGETHTVAIGFISQSTAAGGEGKPADANALDDEGCATELPKRKAGGPQPTGGPQATDADKTDGSQAIGAGKTV